LRGNDGFEDREGHQAPFTLRNADFGHRNSSRARDVMSELQISERLFRLFDRLDDGVEIRPVAGVEFGMEQFAIGANYSIETSVFTDKLLSAAKLAT